MGRRPGPALPADHRTRRGPRPGSCGTGCAAGQRYRRTTATRRAGAGAAGRRGPGPRDPDQLKEREADVRQGKAHQTHPQGVFVDLGAAADRHASWTTVMASTDGGGSHRAGGPEFGTGLTDH